jgi:hypothetical protein
MGAVDPEVRAMPVLPLVDLFILMGTGALGIGFILKAVDLSTRFRPTILGFSSLDFLLMAAVCMGCALTLVARTWMKLNEPQLADLRRRLGQEEARRRVREIEQANGIGRNGEEESPLSAVNSPPR